MFVQITGHVLPKGEIIENNENKLTTFKNIFLQNQTYVVKTGSDSSTAKLSATGVSVTGPRR